MDDLELRYKVLHDLKKRLEWWSHESEIEWHEVRWVLDSLMAEVNYRQYEAEMMGDE